MTEYEDTLKTFDDIYGCSPNIIYPSDKHMTATEVRFRMDESLKRFPTTNFNGALNNIARRMKRSVLLEALKGSRQDRFLYCVSRAASKPTIDLLIYGTSILDADKLSKLAMWWFIRLERLALKVKLEKS